MALGLHGQENTTAANGSVQSTLWAQAQFSSENTHTQLIIRQQRRLLVLARQGNSAHAYRINTVLDFAAALHHPHFSSRSAICSCLSESQCNGVLRNWKGVFVRGGEPTFLAGVTVSCFLRRTYDYSRAGLCAPCSVQVKEELDVVLPAACNKFPQLLGMKDWDTLRATSHSTIPTIVS